MKNFINLAPILFLKFISEYRIQKMHWKNRLFFSICTKFKNY